MPPLTKIWISRLKPGISADDSNFRKLWSEILEFIRKYSGSTSARHQIWQHISRPEIIVMISGYPDQESNDKADSEYVRIYLPRMCEFVDHVDLRQLELDAKTLGMLDAPMLKVEQIPVSRIQAESFVGEEENVVAAVDVWKEVIARQNGLQLDGKAEKTLVKLTGISNEMEAKDNPENLSVMYLKKIME